MRRKKKPEIYIVRRKSDGKPFIAKIQEGKIIEIINPDPLTPQFMRREDAIQLFKRDNLRLEISPEDVEILNRIS